VICKATLLAYQGTKACRFEWIRSVRTKLYCVIGRKKNTTTIVYIISDHTVGLSASRMVLTLAVMETLAHPSDK
jgi:hypothetical protein